MPTRIITGEHSGGRIYTVGRVGYDSTGDDQGGVFGASLRTERFSPAGEGGLVLYRRIQMRVWHTGSFSGTMKVFINGIQTRVLDSASALVLQSLAFSEAAPTSVGKDGGQETIVVMDIGVLPGKNDSTKSRGSSGTYVEVEVAINSDDVTGVLLLESFWVGHRVIRPGLQRAASST